jgi:hypothetical protein
MSVSSEVQRTLVKSPPELWAELSDPATLARHLGELGEIRIVRTEPDRAVDWEAAATDGAQASGRVEIEPSGWGTRVTLSAHRAIIAPEVVDPAPAHEPVAESPAEAPVASVAEPAVEAPVERAADVQPAVEADPEPTCLAEEAEPRQGFFARIFRRRRKEPTAAEPHVEPAMEVQPDETSEADEVSAIEPEITVEPVPTLEPPCATEIDAPAPHTASEPDVSAEPAELEQQTTAVLTGVLDSLGAAHHRPFSRS